MEIYVVLSPDDGWDCLVDIYKSIEELCHDLDRPELEDKLKEAFKTRNIVANSVEGNPYVIYKKEI